MKVSALLLWCFAISGIVASTTAYTDPEGVRLLQDLRNFIGDGAPQSWSGIDPCGTLWNGVECSSDGHVLNVALPSWLPQRQLLQTLSREDQAILKQAINVTGTVGGINGAIGRRFPPDSGEEQVSSDFVAPTIDAIQSGLQSLLPHPLAGRSAETPGPISPMAAPSTYSPLNAGTPFPAEAPMSPVLAPSPSASAPAMAPKMTMSPGTDADYVVVNPGAALSELLNEIDMIREELEMQKMTGRKLLADKYQDIAPQSDATKQDVPSSAPMMEPLPTMSMKSIGPDLAPMPMALKMAPAPSHPYEKKHAPMPMESGVPAELLPEGFTDILEVQEAVGDDKGIGRRLLAVSPEAATLSKSTLAPGPAGYKETLTPDSAPSGLGSPTGPSSIMKNDDGTINVNLTGGSVGGFVLPAVSGILPSQNGIRLVGRRLQSDGMKGSTSDAAYSSPSMRLANTLLMFSNPAPTPAAGPAEGPLAYGYKEVMAPKSAPTGSGSPEGPGVDVNLPALDVGPAKLPAINITLPQKSSPEMTGRKRLQEVLVPEAGPAEGPWAYKEKLVPNSAPQGEGSPGGITLPAVNLGAFHLPELNLTKLPSKQTEP